MQEKQTQTIVKDAESDLLEKVIANSVTYKPFMSDDEISLNPQTIMRYFAKPTKSGKTCTYEQAVRFMGLCKARKLNPWEGDAFIVGYDTNAGPEFNLVTAHQAFLKRAEVHKEYDGMESGVLVRDKDGELHEHEGDFVDDGLTLVGAWARVHMKNKKIPIYRRLKLATFAKNFGRWQVDPAGMIVKCAEADGLRSTFPNQLGGLYLKEEFGAEHDQPKGEFPMPQAVDEPEAPKEEPTPEPEPEPAKKGRKKKEPEPEPQYLLDDWLKVIEETKTLEEIKAINAPGHPAITFYLAMKAAKSPDAETFLKAARAKKLQLTRNAIEDAYMAHPVIDSDEALREFAKGLKIPEIDDMDQTQADRLLKGLLEPPEESS